MKDKGLPFVPDRTLLEQLPPSAPVGLRAIFERQATGDIYLEKKDDGEWLHYHAPNLHFSLCHSCKDVSVWLHDRLLFPCTTFSIEPNADLAPDIQRDFLEAAAIVDASPRGAAALLRLCVQKICIQVGEPGRNVNTDISSLVSKGLNVNIQKALDVVRVVGNEAVHPGVMDLRDDRATAIKLFALVNRIAQDMITHPKEIDKLYSDLPPHKLAEIESRNAKAMPPPTE